MVRRDQLNGGLQGVDPVHHRAHLAGRLGQTHVGQALRLARPRQGQRLVGRVQRTHGLLQVGQGGADQRRLVQAPGASGQELRALAAQPGRGLGAPAAALEGRERRIEGERRGADRGEVAGRQRPAGLQPSLKRVGQGRGLGPSQQVLSGGGEPVLAVEIRPKQCGGGLFAQGARQDVGAALLPRQLGGLVGVGGGLAQGYGISGAPGQLAPHLGGFDQA